MCVRATFFLAHSTSQKTWSQTSCHGSSVGTDDVAGVHTSQPHAHWQMPLTSNTRSACLLTEPRRAVSTVASQQDISECRCQFLQVLSVSEAFFSSGLQAPSQICSVFTFSCTRVCKRSHLQKINAEANVSLDALYTSYSQRNSRKCPPMFKKPPKKSFTKTPLQACQTHLPSTALHRAPSHLISALYAHKSAYTKQQCCTHTPQYEQRLQFREERQDTDQAHRTGEGKARRCQQTKPKQSTLEDYTLKRGGIDKALFLPMPLRK